jgi:hypothetical protein
MSYRNDASAAIAASVAFFIVIAAVAAVSWFAIGALIGAGMKAVGAL